MFCSNCGANLVENAKFCGQCGNPLHVRNQQGKAKETKRGISQKKEKKLIGYSPKINDPAFARYKKNAKRWSLLFSFILFGIAMVGFPVYGEVSGDLEMPYSLYYGLGIGGMFVAIAVVQTISRNRDTTWDGVVADKQMHERRRYDKSLDTFRTDMVFEVTIKRDNGKLYTQRVENDDTLYNYFNIGDKVRHHKGLGGYEKYDKSQDSIIFCMACATLNEISDDVCFRCKCPLLKASE